MLPGFRFLFATIVLSISVLIFGLGAAALLRAAHEEFANPPSWRLAQPQFSTPQFPGQPTDTGTPTLAMLRVDSLAAKTDATDEVQPAALASDGAQPDAPAQAPSAQSAPPEAAPAAEIKPESETKPAAEMPSAAPPPVDTKTASLGPQGAPEAEATAAAAAPETTASVAAPDPTAAPGNPEIRILEAKIPEIKTLETRIPDTKTLEIKTPNTRISAIDSSSAVPSVIPAALPSSSEIKTTFEIRVHATRPAKHGVRKAKRPGIYTAAQRRRHAARMRAIARARAERIAQQRLAEVNPLAQLFGVAPQPPQVQSTPPQQ